MKRATVIGLAARGLAAWLLAASGLAGSARADPVVPPAAAPAHQVLVLLRLPPPHLRGAEDYGDGYDDAVGHAARRRIAAKLARAHGLALANNWAMPLIGVDCYVMAVPADQSIEAAVRALSQAPGVAWAEPMNLFRGQGAAITPNDPLFAAQPAARAWRLADLHQLSTGRGVSVAVIDSMIDAGHPDLAGRIGDRANFVQGRGDAPEGHGTGVAGVIAAAENNGVGVVGVAPRARLMALRACWEQTRAGGATSETVCDTLGLAEALHFAILHNAGVINMSLSGPRDPLLGKLIDAAVARGSTVVGAADRTLPGGGFPASHAGVIAVGEEDSQNGIAAFVPGLYTAPGRDVPTTQPGGQWSLVNGSSFAAAHVSGLFALLRERAPRASTGSALVTVRPGGGAIDACASLIKTSGPCDCACAHARSPTAVSAR